MEEILKALLSSPEGIHAIVEQYKPVVYAVCAEGFGAYKDLVDNDEYYQVRAKDSRKMVEALIDEGFSREEAMDILLSQKVAAKNAIQQSNVKFTAKAD